MISDGYFHVPSLGLDLWGGPVVWGFFFVDLPEDTLGSQTSLEQSSGSVRSPWQFWEVRVHALGTRIWLWPWGPMFYE